jgi:hypothetical protein
MDAAGPGLVEMLVCRDDDMSSFFLSLFAEAAFPGSQ